MVFLCRSAEFFQKKENKEELVVYTVIEKCNASPLRERHKLPKYN
jgi:hypothetical protein